MTRQENEFTPILARTLGEHEKGWNRNEPGQGGYSYKGVTPVTLRNYQKQQGLPYKKPEDLTPPERRAFYEEVFDSQPHYDFLPRNVREVLFDFAVTANTSNATKALQRAIGAKEDGNLGNETLIKMQEYVDTRGEDALVNDITDLRVGYYQGIARDNPDRNRKWLNGWVTRAESYRPKGEARDGF